jgi:hypothetical protein
VSREKGSGRLGVVIWIGILGAAVFAAVQIIPAKVAVYEFHDHIETEARFMATSSRFQPAKLHESIVDKAKELDLELDPKKVDIERQGKHVQVRVQHDVDVDLGVYTWVWKYDKKSEHLIM